MSEVRKRKSSKDDTSSGEPSAGKPAEPALLVEQSGSDKWRKAAVRAIFSVFMLGGFGVIIWAGHFYLTLMVVFLQMLSFKEIIAIGYVITKEKKLPWTRTLNWYFLFASNYYLYGENLISHSQETFHKDNQVANFAIEHHRFISFLLYIAGFVLFVLSLKKGHYKFQFGQFAWTHITLMLITTQSQFIISNIFHGMIWFLLPVLMVICNDIMAYWFGFFFGRTRLIQLSPKKTWEGFIGALFSTVLFGFLASGYLAQFQFFVCPVERLAFDGTLVTCTPSALFTLTEYVLPPRLVALLADVGVHRTTATVYPIQLHSLFLSVFASLIAPFGGFFASGFKRAFKIKDFGDSIPGHGGITDRFDCQYMMGMFAYVYYMSFIQSAAVPDVGKLLPLIYSLDTAKQREVLEALQTHLGGQ